MKPQFVRCEFCKAEVPQEACKLAAHRTVIEGKEYIFCCEKCAQTYRQAKKRQLRK